MDIAVFQNVRQTITNQNQTIGAISARCMQSELVRIMAIFQGKEVKLCLFKELTLKLRSLFVMSSI